MRALTADLMRFRVMQYDADPRSIQGQYLLPHPKVQGYHLFCNVTNGLGWEHVSITIKERGIPSKRASMKGVGRTPTWAEMCHVKSIFWTDDEVAIQFHPRKKDHVSMHPTCLHLWRPTDQVFPEPSALMVGLNPDADPEEILAQVNKAINDLNPKT